MICTKNEMYEAFQNGKKPDQDDFKCLIDSHIHKREDGLFLDDQGNLGIGTDSPDGKIHIKKTSNFSDPGILFEAGLADIAVIENQKLQFGHRKQDGEFIERMQIDGNGNIGIGINQPSHLLEVNGSVKIGTPGNGNTLLLFNSNRSWAFKEQRTGSNAQSTALILESIGGGGNKDFIIKTLATGGVVIGEEVKTSTAKLHVDGVAKKTGGGEWEDTSSDKRVKKNIQDFKLGLSEIKSLRPITYQFNGKAGTPNDGKTYTGFVAQEVNKVCPSMVKTYQAKLNKSDKSDTELHSLDVSELKYMLLNAIVELDKRLLKLEKRRS